MVVHTGDKTYFGSLATSIVGQRQLTSFEKGVNQFTWLMIRFIAVMVPAVFLINGLSKGNWLEAFLFALAVAVGLTPEMLPMIVTVNLSQGALTMARKKVIVKRLNAIQNFGAMDVLCTDKTGTITKGKIVLEKHLDVRGEPSVKVLNYGYLNSYHHTGLKLPVLGFCQALQLLHRKSLEAILYRALLCLRSPPESLAADSHSYSWEALLFLLKPINLQTWR